MAYPAAPASATVATGSSGSSLAMLSVAATGPASLGGPTRGALTRTTSPSVCTPMPPRNGTSPMTTETGSVSVSSSIPIPTGPREAIETYRKILETYPNYERNDQVLYQLSRAYDEVGDPDKAMEVMNRMIVEYPYSRYLDEVQFRRGEMLFLKKRYNDAEQAYDAVVLAVAHRQFTDLGPDAIRAFGKPVCVVYDVKSVLPRSRVDGRL